MSTTASNKALVRRFYQGAINARDLDAVERLLGKGFIHNGERRGAPVNARPSRHFSLASPTSRTRF